MIEDILARVSLLRDELDALVLQPRAADADPASEQPASPAAESVQAAAHARGHDSETGQAAGRRAEQGVLRGPEPPAPAIGHPMGAEPGRRAGWPAACEPDQARAAGDALQGSMGARSASVPNAGGGVPGARELGDQGPRYGECCTHAAAASIDPDRNPDAHLLPAPSTCSDPGRGVASERTLQGVPTLQQAPLPLAGARGPSGARTAANDGGSGRGGSGSSSALPHGAPACGTGMCAHDASSGPGASAERHPNGGAEQSQDRCGAGRSADHARRSAAAAAAALEGFAANLARHAGELRPRSRQARMQIIYCLTCHCGSQQECINTVYTSFARGNRAAAHSTHHQAT